MTLRTLVYGGTSRPVKHMQIGRSKVRALHLGVAGGTKCSLLTAFFLLSAMMMHRKQYKNMYNPQNVMQIIQCI